MTALDTDKLEKTAKQLVTKGKGLLAADESSPSCKKRFDAVGIECTEESRRLYRQILVTAPSAKEHLTGIIFYDETFWQSTDHGKLFRQVAESSGILPGIKVDLGLIDLPGFDGEKLSRGLDTLPDRIADYAAHGARFAKWRSVITIGEGMPTDECIGANTFVSSRYARICQDAGVVPIVEPEVLFDGTHSIDQCEQVMAHTFDILFQTMRAFRVHLPGAILKTSMVLPGKDSGTPINHDQVAERTVKVLHQHVPPELGGVVFLSGGQTPDDAFINLNKIVQRDDHPWGITFSYSRALQDPVLKAWAKQTGNPAELFAEQLKRASAASNGTMDEAKTSDSFVSHAQDL